MIKWHEQLVYKYPGGPKLIGWLLKVKILIHSLVFGWIKIVMILVLVG